MFLNSTILLIYLCWSQSISKMAPKQQPLFVSLRPHKQQSQQVASNQHRAFFIVSLRFHQHRASIQHRMSLRFIPHKKPQLRCWRRPLMVRQPYSEAVWAPFLSPIRGTEGVVKTIERAVGTSPVPWGERGLGKAVEPSLMVKKDGLILEKA